MIMLPKFLGPICNNKIKINNDSIITNDFTYVFYDSWMTSATSLCHMTIVLNNWFRLSQFHKKEKSSILGLSFFV